MGLFSNKDKPCPICGGATPRLLAKKFGGEAICGKCADNIMADDELVKGWTIDDLKEHLHYRDGNRKLVEDFVATRKVDYDREMVIDDSRGLFYVNSLGDDNPPVFRFDEIVGYQMNLGYHTVESWSRGTPRTPYRPPALGLVSGLSMLAEAFGAKGSDKDKDTEFESIKVILQIKTKYLHEYELCDLFISGNGSAEFEHDFAREFAKADALCNLIVSIGNVNTAGAAGASYSAAPAAQASNSADQTADSIKKFKELLDAGIITQEEFDAKKKQLLGI